MHYIYKVMDKRTNKILFKSRYLEECNEYIIDNYCLFSTVIRKEKRF